VELNAMVREGVRLSETYLRQGALRVQVNEAPEALWCHLDRIQCEQVLVNLLRNAADAMSACRPADREIRVAVHRVDGAAKVSIMDRGEGLPAGRESMIFEPFFTTKARGLGLGLAICRNVIAAHAGRLWAENNVGSGATFHITLPLRGDS
jgi:two-component system sensor kinase FixL